jgi:uncharacterized protein YegL
MAQDLMILRQKDLITNPTTRLPVCLCLDTSGSMAGQSISELNKGIQYFFDAIQDDEVAKYSVELSIVAFDSNATKLLDFANIDRQSVPILTANGSTSMGKGVELALNLLEERKKEYSSKGVDYYQPWLVLMTDGEPTDDTSNAANRVQTLASNKKLTVFAVAIGNQANKKVLSQFSTLKDNMVLKVTSAEYFREFFEWLSQSASVASQSVPGDKPKLPSPPPVIEIEL